MTSPIVVTVAVPTFRRPEQLATLLPTLLAQASTITDVGTFTVRLLVVDNDPLASAREVARGDGSAPVRYVVEPIAGISAARNRALDESTSSTLLAFIDDDEHPHDGWLDHLLATWRDFGRPAAVAGRVVAEFDTELDPWLDAGRFFVRRSLRTGTPIQLAAAGNLLLDLDVARALHLRFADDLGLSGGEDTLFTRQLVNAGRLLVWCNESVVTDRVPASRMTRQWVLSRAWSHGNSTSLIDARLATTPGDRARSRVRSVGRGLVRIVGGSLRYVAGLLTRSLLHQARGARAVWRGAGMIWGAFGFVYQEYAREAGATTASGSSGPTDQPPLTVLQSFPEPKVTTNPYIVMLADSLRARPELRLQTFTWPRALFGRYDVFHAHWPEILVTGHSPLKKAIRQALFVVFLIRLRLFRTPWVRTVHNLHLPEGISRRERLLLTVAERWTTLRIRINDVTPLPAGTPSETIVHGHYRDWFARYPTRPAEPGRIGYVGLVRRYKGVDRLVNAFREASALEPDLRLRVAGRPSTTEIADELIALAAGNERISLSLQFLSEAELAEEVTRAELVVLPYREMHNSGGALAALSLSRPVLVPDNEVNRRLAEEVGPGWVYLFSGQLRGQHLADAIAAVRVAGRLDRPDLSEREWHDVGRKHLAAYKRAIGLARRPLVRSKRSR